VGTHPEAVVGVECPEAVVRSSFPAGLREGQNLSSRHRDICWIHNPPPLRWETPGDNTRSLALMRQIEDRFTWRGTPARFAGVES
jgi:hypothetical protein